MFVNMTAAWCVTCLLNERVALASEAVRRAFEERQRRLFQGGLDAAGSGDHARICARTAGSGVPLYVYYPPGGERPKRCRKF